MLHAFIDESGQRGITPQASDYFVVAAVVVRDRNLVTAADLLARMRQATGRQPGQRLHFTRLRPDQKATVAAMLGRAEFLKVSAVIVCKRYVAGLPTKGHEYLFPLRFLLERLSWLAQKHSESLEYTISHVIRFDPRQLREYEQTLRLMDEPECQIHWEHVPSPGRISRPETTELLQMADIGASAIAKAFNHDSDGLIDRDFVRAVEPRLFCPSGRRMTTYGLKIHPKEAIADHAWVTDLRL